MDSYAQSLYLSEPCRASLFALRRPIQCVFKDKWSVGNPSEYHVGNLIYTNMAAWQSLRLLLFNFPQYIFLYHLSVSCQLFLWTLPWLPGLCGLQLNGIERTHWYHHRPFLWVCRPWMPACSFLTWHILIDFNPTKLSQSVACLWFMDLAFLLWRSAA